MNTSNCVSDMADGIKTESKLAKLKVIICDVDGTLTDGGVYYDEHGNELKKFNTRDAAGFFCARAVGIEVIVLTGRECYATTRRMKELHVSHVEQHIADKAAWLEAYMEKNGYQKENVAYIGDDLNDLKPMWLTGYIGCPADAVPEVLDVADYVTAYKGGEGAVRDFVAHILKERGQWEGAYQKAYHLGI